MDSFGRGARGGGIQQKRKKKKELMDEDNSMVIVKWGKGRQVSGSGRGYGGKMVMEKIQLKNI